MFSWLSYNRRLGLHFCIMLCSARCIIVKLWMILRISRRRWMEALCIHWSLFFLLLWVEQETSSFCVIIESRRRAQIIIIIDNRRAAAALGYPAMRQPSIAHLQTCENLKISLSHIIRSRKVITIRQSLTTPNNVVIEALRFYLKKYSKLTILVKLEQREPPWMLFVLTGSVWNQFSHSTCEYPLGTISKSAEERHQDCR